MSPWIGYAVLIAGNLIGIAIRAPHDRQNKEVPIVDDRKDGREYVLLFLMAIGLMVLPVAAIMTTFLSFADYALHLESLLVGTVFITLYLWVLHHSHADLGKNWSVSLQIREDHSLVTDGVYRLIRHPMYAAIYLLAIAQTLLLPNWIAGPAGLIAFTAMFASRMRSEEKMLRDEFGDAYHEYAARTQRLIPGVW